MRMEASIGDASENQWKTAGVKCDIAAKTFADSTQRQSIIQQFSILLYTLKHHIRTSNINYCRMKCGMV